MFYSHSASEKGSKSPQNEDFVLTPQEIKSLNSDLLNKKGYLFVLCDGMGGYAAGETASNLCANYLLRNYYKNSGKNPVSLISELIEKINKKIIYLGKKYPEYYKMGTTLSSLLLFNDKAQTLNVGDSRIYLFDQENLSQITSDDSVIWEYFEQGIISKEQMLTHPLKNLLTRAVGLDAPLILSPETLELPEKFLFTITSDGLTDVTSDQEIAAVLKETVSLQNCSDNLIKLARHNNSIDDVSIILVSNYLK
ncbi:MAG: hypothetical protein APR54_05240 [Candidatus Cloacimonas sp. SDB]|nr:MAG: hypothetical protein APR54_05240 [Candidatus Cloacimonas sp. SDB]